MTTIQYPQTGTYLHTFHKQHGFYQFVTPGDSATQFKAEISKSWDGHHWWATITTYGLLFDHTEHTSLAEAKSHVIAVYDMVEAAAFGND